MSARFGHTLVELIIVLSVGSTLALSAIGIVHRTMTVASTARQQEASQRMAARLSRHFRRDVHAAVSITLDGSKNSNPGAGGEEAGMARARTGKNESRDRCLTLSGKRITKYTIAGGTVLREHERDAGQTHREQFRFGADAHIQIEQLTAPSRAALTIRHGGGAPGSPSRVLLHVEAVIGRKARLDQATGDRH